MRLCCAAEANDFKKAQSLLLKFFFPVHPDAVCTKHKDTTALHIASKGKYLGIVELLITNKDRPADVNKRDGSGETALHSALRQKNNDEIFFYDTAEIDR